MTTRHLVDPELLAFVDSFPTMTLSDTSLPLVRAGMTAMLAAQPLPQLPVTWRDVAVPSGDGERTIRCLLVQPNDMPRDAPAILHFHGGGHVIGAPEMNLPQLLTWAAELNCLILSVDYRLAPETPFPGPIEDGYAALRWLHDSARSLGVDSSRIAVSGESAGGAMAACLCILARDRGEFGIAFQHLEAPRLEDVLPDPADANPFTGEFVWTRANSEYCRKAYLKNGDPSPYASAARASDLTSLPPAFISVGALDLFVDECQAFALRLIRSGVPVELIVYPGCFHGFRLAKEASVSLRAQNDSLQALKKALAK